MIRYASNFGILLRGNYSANTDNIFNSKSGLYPVYSYGSLYYPETGGSRETRSTWGDVQLSYGFTTASNVTAGVSYTFGLFEEKNLYDYFNNSVSVYGPSSYRDTVWDHNGTVDNETANLRSHTLRAGFRWDKPDNQIEIIGTVEALNGSSERTAVQNSDSYETYRSIDTARPYVSYRGTFEKVTSAADVKGINARVDFRYHKQLVDGRTFTAQVGGGFAHFSAEDNQLNMSQSIDSAGQSYTYGSSSLSRWTRAATPDGSGFQANGSAGWTVPLEPFLLAAATVVNVSHIVYDYTALGFKGDTLSQIQGGRDTTIRAQANGIAVPHSQSVLALRLAVPIAIEVEALKGFHIRAGWVPQYIRRVNKDDSNENGFRETSDNLDASTMTFGLGYQIIDRLRVDMVNEGDIAQPRTWNIAAQYTF